MGLNIVLVVLFVAAMIIMSMRGRGKKNIVFFGDSITAMASQGDGYVQLIGKYMHAEGLDERYNIINAGVSGNKVYDLYLRMETDVTVKAPRVVVLFIGVNDVRHKLLFGTGTDYDRFTQFYEAIVNRLRAADSKVILCIPAVSGEHINGANAADKELDAYCDWIRNYAVQQQLPLVDLRKVFTDYIRQNNIEDQANGILTTDGVHLNKKGNELVAAHIWETLAVLLR